MRFIQNNFKPINNSASIFPSHILSVSLCLYFSKYFVFFLLRNHARQMNITTQSQRIVQNLLGEDVWFLLVKLVYISSFVWIAFKNYYASKFESVPLLILICCHQICFVFKHLKNKQCVNKSPRAKPYPSNDQLYYVCEPEFVILGSCPDGMVISSIVTLSYTCDWTNGF